MSKNFWLSVVVVELRFNDASTHEGHLCQNGVLTWFCNGMAIMMSYLDE